jgi:hypothetical protein
MSRPLTVELSDLAYARLEENARATAQSPADLAGKVLEQRFAEDKTGTAAPDTQTARARYERHFGAVDLGHPTATDNESIDADLARAYGDSHEGG